MLLLSRQANFAISKIALPLGTFLFGHIGMIVDPQKTSLVFIRAKWTSRRPTNIWRTCVNWGLELKSRIEELELNDKQQSSVNATTRNTFM
jgi:hypothetical protein